MIRLNWNPSRRDLRIFSVLLIVFFGIVAAGLHWKHHATTWAVVVVGTATVLGITCWFLPPLARRVYLGWMLAVFPIGWTVSVIILSVIFYGVVTPLGLLMRLFGYDPLHRNFEPDAPTYWTPRTEQPPPERYFRQF